MAHKYHVRIIICLGMSLLLGAFLWFSSDAPPYGMPINELSNSYWCYMQDIAHKWRTGNFALWNPSLAGGTSLFTSGQYPFLSPTNMVALVLDDNQFYLFKLIEPYVIGCFFMSLLLVDIFGLPFLYAFIGAFFFLGLPLGIHTPMPQSPVFLWGCYLFPAMVYVYFKFSDGKKYLNTALVGALIALQFAAEGVTQMPQVLIWWWIFMLVPCLWPWPKGILGALKGWVIHCTVLTTMAVGLCAVQFIPTLEFFRHESSRVMGYYPINNFPLVGNDPHTPSFLGLLNDFIFHQRLMTFDVPLGLLCALALLIFILLRRRMGLVEHAWLLGRLWAATGIFILMPSLAEMLSSWFPLARAIFENITTFTFRYGIHIFDFTLALSLALILGSKSKAPSDLHVLRRRGIYALGIVVMVFMFLTAWSCYRLNNKGMRTHLADYHMDSPEYAFFKKASGQYYLPYDLPVWMAGDFNLLWGVHGVSGFLPLPPQRIGRFMCAYHFNDRPSGKMYGYRAHLQLINPSGGLAQWFPVDFTTIEHDKNLSWPNFKRQIEGEVVDVWVREGKTPQVYFGNAWQAVSLEELFDIMDQGGPQGIVYLENNDVVDAQLPKPSMKSVEADYSSFVIQANRITFDVKTASDVIVVVPRMYQRHWSVWVNGKPCKAFAANYLFVGFYLPDAGNFHIEMTFIPKGFWIGLGVNILSFILFLYLLKRKSTNKVIS